MDQNLKKIRFQDMNDDFRTYFKWSANALMPINWGAADRFLKEDRSVILKIARILLHRIHYTPGLLYRGIILKDCVDVIAPKEKLEYLSFSTARQVAEHFADVNGFGSKVMDIAARLGTHGYIIEYTPKIDEVLFHYHLLSVLPYAEAFDSLGMDGNEEVEGLRRQQEVIIVRPGEAFTNVIRKGL